MRWIRCTHVCHAWREIALNSPTLWSDIDDAFPKWAEQMLARSKMADLKVNFKLSYDRMQWATRSTTQAVLANAFRIQDLSIQVEEGTHRAIFPYLPKSAPRLQSLNIRVNGWPTAPRSTSTLPKESFLQTERLKSLEISGCVLDWAHHLARKNTLTVLRLRDSPNISSIPADQFIDIFAQLGSLETLELASAFPIVEAPLDVHSRPRVRLQLLQELTLLCTPEQVDLFFRFVDVPPGIIVDITSEGHNNANFTGILASLSSILSPEVSSPRIQSLTFYYSTGLRMSAHSCLYQERSLAETFGAPDGQVFPTKLVFSLTLTLSPSNSVERDELWTSTFSSLPLSNTVEATVFSMDYLSCATMANTLGRLPHLTSLVLMANFCGLAEMLQETQPDPDEESPLSPPKLVFSQLRSLTMDEFSFLQSDGLPLDSFIESLIWRYEHGAEIERLNLQYCYGLCYEDVNLLREVVVDVIWDENEDGRPSFPPSLHSSP